MISNGNGHSRECSPGDAGAAGPVVAHAILVGSWVGPPAMLLAGGIAAGWPFGFAGAAAGTAVTGALFVGPASPCYRGTLCYGLCALAMAAGKGKREWAVAAAAGVAALTAALHVRWRPSERFFNLITQTLRGSDYYAAAELRGAIENVRPGRNFYACHPHGCLSAGWTWNVCATSLPPSPSIHPSLPPSLPFSFSISLSPPLPLRLHVSQGCTRKC
jgi:hypothetical protein